MEVRQIMPMLAKSAKPELLDQLFEDPKWVAEEKIDGERNLLHIMPDGSAVITSRRISKKTGKYAEKSEHVPHLTAPGTWPTELAGTVLDGEMVHPRGFKHTAQVFRSLPERAIEIQQRTGFITYRVFDILYYKDQDVMDNPLWKRKELIKEVLEMVPDLVHSAAVSLIPSVTVDKLGFLRRTWADGGEGIILKHLEDPYLPGNRSKWVKVKSEMTEDVVIIGYEEAEMDYTGKYERGWPYWAYYDEISGTWLRIVEGHKSAFEGKFEIKPVTSLWYHHQIGAIKYGQYVPHDKWVALGKPKAHGYFTETDQDGNEVRYYLVEMGQCSGMDSEFRQAISENRDYYLGKVIEVKANGRFEDTGKLRHPQFMRFREDKNVEDCRWE